MYIQDIFIDITLAWQWARDWGAIQRQQATLPRFPHGENSFQIRNSLKWNLTKDRSRGAALIQRPLAIPTEYTLYDYHLLYQWLIMDMHDELKSLYIFFFP